MIVGRNVEVAPNQRIVQFELKGQASETRLVFDHSDFPEDQQEHLEAGGKKCIGSRKKYSTYNRGQKRANRETPPGQVPGEMRPPDGIISSSSNLRGANLTPRSGGPKGEVQGGTE